MPLMFLRQSPSLQLGLTLGSLAGSTSAEIHRAYCLLQNKLISLWCIIWCLLSRKVLVALHIFWSCEYQINFEFSCSLNWWLLLECHFLQMLQMFWMLILSFKSLMKISIRTWPKPDRYVYPSEVSFQLKNEPPLSTVRVHPDLGIWAQYLAWSTECYKCHVGWWQQAYWDKIYRKYCFILLF